MCRALLTLLMFAIFPTIGYLSTYSITNGNIWPDPSWLLFFFNFNGAITIFIGWFITFAFADFIFVKFGLFDDTKSHTHKYSQEIRFSSSG